MNPSSPQPHPLGLALFVAFVGASMIFNWWPTISLGRASVAWPRVAGRILHSADARESIGRGGSVSVPSIDYEFTVDGKPYHGSMISVEGGVSFGRGNTYETHPPGSTVMVSYDPKNPSRSMLEPGIYHDAYTWIAIGTFLILVGAAIAIF